MTREEIIRMARAAGCKPFRSPEHWDDVQVFATPDVLERFAALVAAAERKRIESTPWGAGKEWIARAIEAEREACAMVAEQWPYEDERMFSIAQAIRSRGEQ